MEPPPDSQQKPCLWRYVHKQGDDDDGKDCNAQGGHQAEAARLGDGLPLLLQHSGGQHGGRLAPRGLLRLGVAASVTPLGPKSGGWGRFVGGLTGGLILLIPVNIRRLAEKTNESYKVRNPLDDWKPRHIKIDE